MAKYTVDKELNKKGPSNWSSNDAITKSYTFNVKSRFDVEKKITLVIWIIEDLGKAVQNGLERDFANNLSGYGKKNQDGSLDYFDLDGNIAGQAGFFALPNTNPKNGSKLEDEPGENYSAKYAMISSKVNLYFDTFSLKGLQDAFDSGQIKEGKKPTDLDSYIDYLLYTAGFKYKRSIYQVVVTSREDLPKFDLPENSVEFTQTPPQEDKPPTPTQEATTPTKEPFTSDFRFNVETPNVFKIVGSSSIVGDLKVIDPGLIGAISYSDETDEEDELEDEYSEVEGEFGPEFVVELKQSEADAKGQEFLVNLDQEEEAKKNESKPPVESENKSKANDTNPQNLNTVAKGKMKKMLEIAAGEIGYKETRNPNLAPEPKKDTKYGVYWGMNGHHYCGMFVNWCAEQAGIKKLKRGKTDKEPGIPDCISCPAGVAAWKGGGLWVSNGDSIKDRENSRVIPEPGDVVFFNFKGVKNVSLKDNAEHVGLVEKDNGDGTVTCIEGNTSLSGGTANAPGSGVNRKVRKKVLILGYGKTAKWNSDNTAPFTGPIRPKSA